jgi:hypothetical protein
LQAPFSDSNDGDGDASADAAPPPESDCPLSPLLDDFEDGIYADRWPRSWVDVGVAIREETGLGIIALSGTQPAFGGFGSARFDARDTCTYVEVVRMLDHSADTSAKMFLMLKEADGYVAYLEQAGGQLACAYKVGGAETKVIGGSYDPEQHQWFRLRVVDTTVYCGVSADRISWEEITLADVPVDFSSAVFIVMAGTNEGEADPGQVEIDNVNR